MKKILMIAGASMIVLPACPASAEVTFTGELGMSFMFTNVEGNKTKFNEYRDVNQDTAYSRIRLKYDTDDFFIKAKASDIGYDTQNYELEGGMYGNFKAFVKYSEIPNNLTLGATTFYSGIGTNHLTSPRRVPPVSAWQPFDYATKREAVDFGVSVDRWKPFFFEFSSPNEHKTGTYPLGFSVTGATVEVPKPIDYTTNTINMLAGYAKNPYFAAVSVFYSQFDNTYSTFIVDSPGTTTQNSNSLPPDNEAYKVAFKGSVKQLPFNSQFTTNLGIGRMTADQSVLTGGNIPAFGPVFHGKVDTNNLDLVLFSNPVHLLSAKIYYNYNERRNESDQLTFGANTNTLLGYGKSKAGIDLGWNLPAKFKLDTGYSYMIMDRDGRDDIPETIDNTLSAELKYRGFDFMTPKISYQWLQRSANHQFDPAVDDASEAYIWRFDVAPKVQSTLKASVDIYPTSNLNLTVGYKLIDIDYSDTVLGLKSSRSDQVNLDVGYTFGKFAKLSAYYDLELQKSYQFQRTNAATSPSSGNSAAAYNWDVTLKDNSYSWGAGSEIYLMPKTLSLLLQYDNVNSNGNSDFTLYFLPAGVNNNNVDMANWDDYRLSSYSIRLRYATASQYTFTLGYAYQYYKYNSAQWGNYLQQQGTTYLTGAYANPNYDAQIVFAAVDYKF